MADTKVGGKKSQQGTSEPLIPGPYPFKASLEQGTVKKTVDVIFVGLTGFIARMGTQFVQVGEYYQVIFELPNTREFINAPVRVIKTYDRASGSKATKADRMAEFHFQKLIDDHRIRINQFIIAIGQAK